MHYSTTTTKATAKETVEKAGTKGIDQIIISISIDISIKIIDIDIEPTIRNCG